MRQCLFIVIGLILILVQTLIGARALFPEAFNTPDTTLDELLTQKKPVMELLGPEDLAFISNNPVVTAGVDPNFYPLEMFDEKGNYSGLGSDYLRLLKKMTGIEIRPLALGSWAETVSNAQKGNVDLFMAAAQTGTRSGFMTFTPPYVNLPGVIMTRRDSGLDNLDIKKLAGKKVAVTKDYSWHDFLKEFHPEIIPVPAVNTLEALRKVTDGEADAILDYEFNLLEKLQAAGIMQMHKAGEVDSNYGHAVGVIKNKPELFNIISIAMAQITPAERARLAQKWLNHEKPADTSRQWQWIFFFISESVLLCLALLALMQHRVRRAKQLACKNN